MREWEVWDAELVDALKHSWTKDSNEYHWQLINKANGLIEGDSVLDIGCGLGHLYALLKNKHIKYMGIDTSKEMIKAVQNYYQDKKELFQYGDIFDLSQYLSFDTVIAVGVFVHLPIDEVIDALNQMWNNARICIVFSVNLGERRIIRKHERKKGKYLIERTDTEAFWLDIIDTLEDVAKVEKIPFSDHPIFSNTFFRIYQKR